MPVNPYEPPRDADWTETPAIGEPIRVGGRLTLDDFDRIYGGGAFARWQARFTYAAVVVIWFGYVAMIVLGSPEPLGEQLTTVGMPHYMIVTGLLLIGFFLWLQYSIRRNLRNQYQNQEGLFEPQQLEISDDGIALTTSHIQSRLRWDAFSSARIQQDYLILYLKPGQNVALHIARSWFQDEGPWRRLYDFVKHRLPEAK